MAGFDADAAREQCGVPEEYELLAMIALGHQGPADALPDDLREREQSPRARRAQSEFVFGATYGTAVRTTA